MKMIDFKKVAYQTLKDAEGNEVKEYTYQGDEGQRGMSDDEIITFELHKKNEALEEMLNRSKDMIDQANSISSVAKMAKKIANVIKETKEIKKSGWNSFHLYEYATESDVKNGVRNVMADNDLILMNHIKNYEETTVTTRKGGKEFQVKLHVEYTLIDAETGYSRTFTKIGVGQDAGDKAFYKAETGALKYALTTLFLLPSGDGDPETDGRENDGTKKDDKPEEKDLLKMKTTAEFIMKTAKMESSLTIVGFLQSVANKCNILDEKGNAKDPDQLNIQEVAKMNVYLGKWKVMLIDQLKKQQNANDETMKERHQQQEQRKHNQAQMKKDASQIFGGRK